jgi:regulator of sigma E protease
MTFLSAIILLGIIIFIHELGHFLAAKALGVRVLKFSLGFGPKIIGKTYGHTEYLLSSIPLGGYVKMLGEEQGDELTEDEKKFSYNQQPVWKRFLIVFSGPLFNMLFAVIIFFFVFLNGLPVLLPETGSVTQNSPAEKAGLIKGDAIISINNTSIAQWDEMTDIIHGSPGKTLHLKVKRQNEILEITVVPEKKKLKDIFGQDSEVGLIGITPSGNTVIRKEGLGTAVNNAIIRTLDISALTILSLVKLIQRVVPVNTLGGPILIVQMAGEQASKGFMDFFVFMAIININLGILNLLPIPILDGGHILFLGIEAIRRKPVSERIVAVAQRVGLALLLSIMAFAVYNDIIRVITGKTLP